MLSKFDNMMVELVDFFVFYVVVPRVKQVPHHKNCRQKLSTVFSCSSKELRNRGLQKCLCQKMYRISKLFQNIRGLRYSVQRTLYGFCVGG